MKLLEVIRTTETSEATYQTAMAFGKKLGKTCVTCKGEHLEASFSVQRIKFELQDTPGFVVNRLMGPYLAEAINMVEVSLAIL